MTASSTIVSVKDFYREVFGENCHDLDTILNDQQMKDLGHFNVFNFNDVWKNKTTTMPYSRKVYYKISLIRGNNNVEYADKVFEIKDFGILFATPKVPYRYIPQGGEQGGHFCIFTKDFLAKSKSGFLIDEVPIFQPNTDFVYHLTEQQYRDIETIYQKMHTEIASDYAFKYDLLRTYLIELIHTGQKLSPVPTSTPTPNAAMRISMLFIELLERQFPIESSHNTLQLTTAKDYADSLNIHANHLNKVLKEVTGKTTTEIIASRITQEAKILLKQTTWNVSEIAYSLGFEEIAHFSNFFKKHTHYSPLSFREL
jgi:AraC-like DNA-binding protein